MSGSARKRPALDPRTRGGKPSRHASVYTLRFLKYATGDPSIAGTPQRTPSFDVIFFDILHKFHVQNEVWMQEDALGLCSLAILTLFYIKFILIDITAAKKTGEDDEMVDDEDDDDDDARTLSNDDKEVPKWLLPKLVNIVVAIENVFAYADSLKSEVRWIHEVSRKFRAATRGIISGSKSIASTCVWESLEDFAKAIDEIPKDVKVWEIDDVPITTDTCDLYFTQSEIVVNARQVESDKRTLPNRMSSFSAHLSETQNDINLIKEAFYLQTKMVCALIVFIVFIVFIVALS